MDSMFSDETLNPAATALVQLGDSDSDGRVMVLPPANRPITPGDPSAGKEEEDSAGEEDLAGDSKDPDWEPGEGDNLTDDDEFELPESNYKPSEARSKLNRPRFVHNRKHRSNGTSVRLPLQAGAVARPAKRIIKKRNNAGKQYIVVDTTYEGEDATPLRNEAIERARNKKSMFCGQKSDNSMMCEEKYLFCRRLAAAGIADSGEKKKVLNKLHILGLLSNLALKSRGIAEKAPEAVLASTWGKGGFNSTRSYLQPYSEATKELWVTNRRRQKTLQRHYASGNMKEYHKLVNQGANYYANVQALVVKHFGGHLPIPDFSAPYNEAYWKAKWDEFNESA